MVDTGADHEESGGILLLDEFLADMVKLDNQTPPHNANNQFADSTKVVQRASKVRWTAKTTTEPQQKKKAHSWLRRKQELEALRRQTQELETRVAFLKLQQEKKRLHLGISREQLSLLYENKRAADRELQQLQGARNENAALKRDFRAYIRASTSWHAAVSAANRGADASDILLPMSQALETGVLQQLQISSLNTFNELEERVNRRFLEFQTILDEIVQASVTLDSEQVQTCRGDNDTTSYNFTRILPFDEKTTLNAAWSIVMKGGITQKHTSNVMRRSKDVHAVDSRFVLPIAQGEVVVIDIHCVVKRFEVPGACVLLAEGRSEASVYRGHSIVRSQESQESIWFIVRRLSLRASNANSDDYPGSECQMKAVVRSETPRSCGSDCTQKAPLAFAQDLAVSSFRELIDSQQQCWENLLWDSVRAANKYHP
ncbi:uncharacterized protein KRP23_12068 [Phytophthora ramorum]|uniref:uncharacterized protein n=1 Tax=Phytophthora ramorum TaxID=164328 RepID=UPI00309DB021|nr:hypothetical protein KRP23_12068 [Phytophthora ramorum]